MTSLTARIGVTQLMGMNPEHFLTKMDPFYADKKNRIFIDNGRDLVLATMNAHRIGYPLTDDSRRQMLALVEQDSTFHAEATHDDERLELFQGIYLRFSTDDRFIIRSSATYLLAVGTI